MLKELNPSLTLKMKEGLSHGRQAAPGSWNGWKRCSPRASGKEHGPAGTLTLAQGDPHNCKIINPCCFKPLNVW